MRLKNDLEREFGAPIRVRAGTPGAFDVFVDGDQVYSKKQSGRLPKAGEVTGLIRARIVRG